MVTLLHTADTHVGYRQYHRPEREADFRDAFYQVIDEAISRDVDAVVHAGDLFNSSRPGIEALSDALSGLKRLRDANIPFLSIVGNHDGTRDRQWLDVFASLGLAIRLGDSGFSIRSEWGGEIGSDDGSTGDEEGGGGESCHLALYGLDHVERGKRDRLDYAFDPDKSTEADATVLVAHGLFKPFPNGDWDARAICRQSTVEFDAILAGDDHTNQETFLTEFGTLLTYPGSTERTAADQRDPRGFDLVDVSPEGEIELEFEELETRPFVYVDVELADGEGLDRVFDALGERHDERAESERRDTGSGFEESVVVVTLTGAGERVPSGPIEEFGLGREALTVRVNDRREWSEELREYDEVAFADPDRAVEERRETLGLSENGRAVERVVRDTEAVPESNVTDVIEARVREWLDASIEAFERTESVDEEASGNEEQTADAATNERDEDGETTTDPTPESAGDDPESVQASEPTGADGSEVNEDGSEVSETGPATDSDANAVVVESESERGETRDTADATESKGSEPGPGDTSREAEMAELDETSEADGTEEAKKTGASDESEKAESSDGNEADERTTQATLWD